MTSRLDHADRVETELAAGRAAQDALIASWQRSVALYDLEPGGTYRPQRLTEQELNQARERMGPLLATAKAGLDELYHAVGNVGCCVLFADPDGVPLARRGSAGDDDMFESWGLWTGALWSEAIEGTNGIGTCIAEKRPVTIHKDQHFRAKNIDLSCMGAPVFDHEGKLAAVIDVSSCRADVTAAFSRLIARAVLDAACRIETTHFRTRFSKARILLAGSKADQSGAEDGSCRGAALVAVDDDDLVIGATRRARRLYRLDDATLKRPLPLSELIDGGPDKIDDLSKAESRIIRQALARSRGNVSKAAEAIGISRSTLHRKIRRFNIPS